MLNQKPGARRRFYLIASRSSREDFDRGFLRRTADALRRVGVLDVADVVAEATKLAKRAPMRLAERLAARHRAKRRRAREAAQKPRLTTHDPRKRRAAKTATKSSRSQAISSRYC
jgi:hypothetical protein